MRLTRSLYSLLVCSVVFSGGGLAAVGEEDDGSFHVNSWVVEVHAGEGHAAQLAEKHGFIKHGQVAGLENMFEFEHVLSPKRSATPHRELHHRLTKEEGVGYVAQQVAKRRSKRGYDPPTDPKFSQEWYLKNEGGRITAKGFDLNVEPVWKMGFNGNGVVVSILDDGIERTNPDLIDNYDPEASCDVNGKDPDPMPRYDYSNENKHGTRCAGEVAAARNGFCAVGVAYKSSIGGIRMLDGSVTDVVEGHSLAFRQGHIDIYSSSWGPDDDGRTLDGPGPLAQRAFKLGVETGRGGRGSIFVWAGGNGGRAADSCSCDGYVVSPYTVAVGAVAEDGSKPWYAEECPALLAVTPSSGSRGQRQISTCDLRNTCTSSHTGTSAAAPLAAGVIALALQANRNLTWRDVQHIIVLTSRKDHLQSPSWITNGAGLQFSHRFGFGVLDAAAIVNRALHWVPVPERLNCSVRATGLPKSISKSGLIQFQVPSSCPVTYIEHVVVNTSITVHGKRGDVQIKLRSPLHTNSILLPKRRSDYFTKDISHWPFMTLASWGEDPRGVWSVTIQSNGELTATEMELLVFGTADRPVAMKRIPRYQCHSECRGGCAQEGAEFCDDCLHYRVNSSRECVEECPAGTYAEQDVCWSCDPVCLTCTGPGATSCSVCSPDTRMVKGQCLADKEQVDQATAPSEDTQPPLTSLVVASKAQGSESASRGPLSPITHSGISSAVTPDIASSSVTPDSASSANTPDSASSSVTPDSASLVVTPDSASLVVTPDSASSANTPDSASSSVILDSASLAVTPYSGYSTNKPDSASSSVTLDSASLAVTPDSGSSTNTPDSVSSSVTVDSASSSVTPDTTEGHSQLVKEGPHAATTSHGHFPVLSSVAPTPVTPKVPHRIVTDIPQPPLCETGCLQCASPQRCLVCEEGMVLQRDKCEGSCGEGYAQVMSRCVRCIDSHCSRCENSLKCDICVEGYYLSSFGLCQECDEGCARCTGRGACLECSKGAVACEQRVEGRQHRYSTVVGVVVVGTCLLILAVTGTLIGTILCKHRLRVGFSVGKKDIQYKPVRKDLGSDSEEELYGQ